MLHKKKDQTSAKLQYAIEEIKTNVHIVVSRVGRVLSEKH